MTCVVGCCPTMTQEAAARAERNGCEVRTFGSAAQALAQLKAKNGKNHLTACPRGALTSSVR